VSTAGPRERERTATGAGLGLRRGPWALAWLWLFWFAASLLLYWPGLRAGYFSDDLLFFYYSPPRHLWDYFAQRGAAAQAYRPLEAIILSLIQQKFRFETLPIHLLSLSAHAGLCCIVWTAARKLEFRPIERWFACILMLVAQVGVPALLGNDTLSQSASAFLGSLSALFLAAIWWRERERDPAGGSGKWLIASVAAYTGSLFFKETGLGFALVAALLIGAIAFKDRPWKVGLTRAALLALPYGAATLAYLAARLHAGGAVSHSGSYQIRVGLNVIRNILEFTLAAFGPMSTVDGAVALAMHRIPELMVDVLGCLLILAVMAAGILVPNKGKLAVWLTALALASLFPAYLLTHVSELYLYNAVPFLALVMGMAFGGLWYRTRWLKAASGVCAALLVCGQIYAVREKAGLMALNGIRAGEIYSDIDRILPALRPYTRIFLVNSSDRNPEYSVFLLKGFDVVDLGNLRIGPILGRPDVRVELIEEPQVEKMEGREDAVFFSQNSRGGLQPYRLAAGGPPRSR